MPPSTRPSTAASSTPSTTVAVTLRLRPELQMDDDDVVVRGGSAPPGIMGGGAALLLNSPSSRQPVMLDDMHGAAGIAAYRESKFRFAHTFGPHSTTADVFAAQEASVLAVLKGFDATVMAYGSTGAGKTHTMIGDEAEPGVLPLALDALFARISSGDASYSLQLSALELLEERCVDLLHGRGAVVLRAAPKGGLCFSGLKEVPVHTKHQLLAHIHAAMDARTTAANYKHDASSRSHFVVRLRIDGARFVSLAAAGAAGRSRAAGAPPKAVDGADGVDGVDLDGGGSGTGSPTSSSSAGSSEGGGMCVRDATSATLTFVDLAGSEAATQNASAAAVSQGVHINKSLHWLKVAVHDLAARRTPSTLRNSALTRLLAPSLSGGAHVAIIVCSSARPASSGSRDAMETLAFGETAGRVVLAPQRRTDVGGDGQLGKLQSLLVQMADDKSALASDAQSLRDQVEGYEQLIASLRSEFISRESLSEAEEQRATAQKELASAQARNERLQARCREEEAARASLALQLADVEARQLEEKTKSSELEQQTRRAAEERAQLEARLTGARSELAFSQQAAAAREAELLSQRSAVASLREHVGALEAQLQAEREAAQRREAEAAALAQSNSALQARVQAAREGAKAKDHLLLIKHKLYRQNMQRRPSTAHAAAHAAAGGAAGGSSGGGRPATATGCPPTLLRTATAPVLTTPPPARGERPPPPLPQPPSPPEAAHPPARPAAAAQASPSPLTAAPPPVATSQLPFPSHSMRSSQLPSAPPRRPTTPPPPPLEPEEFEQPPLHPEEEATFSATVRQSRQAWEMAAGDD